MLQNIKNEKHEFALFFPEIPNRAGLITITDHEFIHRLVHVLRLTIDDSFILFNQHVHAHVHLIAIKKKAIEITINSITINKSLQPIITVGLPLLKRDAFEQALYTATELGANEIQLLITEKSQRTWTEKDLTRAKNIIHAAAEQSKNFSFPPIQKPMILTDFRIKNNNQLLLFFDPTGKSISEVIVQAQSKKHSSYFMLVGPEGDLTHREKEFLKQQEFVFTRLTPTILRAYQAVTVGLGVFRSFLS